MFRHSCVTFTSKCSTVAHLNFHQVKGTFNRKLQYANQALQGIASLFFERNIGSIKWPRYFTALEEVYIQQTTIFYEKRGWKERRIYDLTKSIQY